MDGKYTKALQTRALADGSLWMDLSPGCPRRQRSVAREILCAGSLESVGRLIDEVTRKMG